MLDSQRPRKRLTLTIVFLILLLGSLLFLTLWAPVAQDAAADSLLSKFGLQQNNTDFHTLRIYGRDHEGAGIVDIDPFKL